MLYVLPPQTWLMKAFDLHLPHVNIDKKMYYTKEVQHVNVPKRAKKTWVRIVDPSE